MSSKRDTQIEVIDPKANGAIVRKESVGVMDMIEAIVAHPEKLTAESVGALRELAALHKDLDAHNNKQAFAVAFKALQADLRPVTAMRAVNNKDGSERYRFAPYEDLMQQVQPHLDRHGFSISFDCDFADGRVMATCTIMHEKGHERATKFACRVGSGPQGTSESQADGAATTYAKRYALCNALNIVVERDTDARGVGSPISADQAADLERRIRALPPGGDESARRFLKWAGVDDFSKILSAAYEEIMDDVTRREAKAKQEAEAAKVEPPVCGYLDADDWRSATLDALVKRKFDLPLAVRSFDHAIKNPPIGCPGGYKDTTPEQRELVWRWIGAGKFDPYLKAKK